MFHKYILVKSKGHENKKTAAGFSACNCLFDSRHCLLTSLKLGSYYKLNWPKRASAVYWLLGTLPLIFSSLSTLFSPLSTFRSLLNVRHLEGLSSEVSLLHMNCEGCEWEMLENLLDATDLIQKVRQAF